MAVIAAAVVPHAPLLLLGGAPATETAARAVLRSLPSDVPWVVASPHGLRTAVRAEGSGSLGPFGIAREVGPLPADVRLAEAAASGWTEVVPPDPADQGMVVPLALLDEPRTVIPLSLTETTGPSAAPLEDVLTDVKRAGDVLAELAAGDDFVLVASAHTAATLAPRGPLLEKDEGHALHSAVLVALRSGTGMVEIEADLWRAAGSCGAGPFRLLARLSDGRPFEVRCEEAPFGVGYVTALSLT